MSRPVLILIALAALILIALVGLAMLDRETTVTHVERPLTNEAAK